MDQEIIANLPEKPGVYVMYDEKGNVIYIGKSVNLRNRVSSYFSNPNLHRRTKNMVSTVRKIDYFITNNEAEALILEATLIKKHKPKYNILMKDSKFFPFVKVSKHEFPYIIATRKYYSSDDSIYYGPYIDSKVPYMLVEVIQKLFKIRTCVNMPKKVCLNYHIGYCSGPCEGKISKEEYNLNVVFAKKLLEGNISELISDLENKMKMEAKEMNFEKAAFYRDAINLIKQVENQKQWVFSSDTSKNCDYISYSRTGNIWGFIVVYLRNGKVVGKNTLFFDEIIQEKPFESFLSSIYFITDNPDIPKKIVVENELIEKAKEFFKNFKSFTIDLSIPDIEDENVLKIAKSNISVQLQDYISRLVSEDQELNELCKILEMEKISIIDGFDVANYGDEIAVGSCVRFVDGEPDKRFYRIFKIKNVSGQNDFAMIKESVYRRYKNLEEELPDLVVIDGGMGQLNMALQAVRELGIKLRVISISKKEEKIHLPSGEEIKLSRNSPALKILQKVRDEAHRFGNMFVKKLKIKKSIENQLNR